MNWREAHEEAMFAASEVHDELSIDTTQRIDVFAVIASLGLELLFRPLRGASGLYVPGESRAESGVLVTSTHRLARQRFTAAHELAHFWLKHEASLDVNTELLARSAMSKLVPDEMVAEAFAAWFLMPPELVDLALEDLGKDGVENAEDVYALSLRLGTSHAATAYHLPNLKLADYDTAKHWATEPPKGVKAMLSRGIGMESYYSDVWTLSERDANGGFQVQAGDRLVVTLPEIPSSGYMWRTEALPPSATVVADTMEDELIEPQGTLLSDADHPPGAEHPRTLIVDLDGSTAGSADIALVKAPVWAPEETADRFLIHLDIGQPLLGRVLSAA